MSYIKQEGMTGAGPADEASCSVSVISQKTGLTPRQLYYWESVGLVKPLHLKFGRRSFRRYRESDFERLLEIKAWLDVGYTLEAVKKITQITQKLTQKEPGSF